MKKNLIFQVIASIISGISIFFAFYWFTDSYFEKFFNINTNFKYFLIPFGLLISASIVFITSGTLRKRFPQKFSVAIIGFPRTGKTTLLITLYDQILSKRIDFYKIKIVGSETIERVNQYISYLKSGKQIPSTTDQDVYAYRTTIETKSFFSKSLVQVEFGDFPGEQSVQFAEKYENWFHRTPYFRWVKDANAYIYVIDCGEYLIKKTSNDIDNFRIRETTNDFRKYKAETMSSMRTSWQHLLEYNFDIKLNIANNPLILIFTKSDTLMHYVLFNEIMDRSSLKEINYIEYENDNAKLLQDYLNIISYNEIPMYSNNLSRSKEYDIMLYWVEVYLQIFEFLRTKFDYSEMDKIFENINNSQNIIDRSKIDDYIVSINKTKIKIEKDFNDIIKYFEKESSHFNKLYMSSFGVVNDRQTDSEQYKQLLDYLFPNL